METGIGREFLHGTKYQASGEEGAAKRVQRASRWMGKLREGETIPLPKPEALRLAPLDFPDLVTRRSSLRRYGPGPITKEELSFLLWCTQGVKKDLDPHGSYRTVPSAGARHAFETFLLVHRVEGLAPGLWGFHPIDHALVFFENRPTLDAELVAGCLDQPMISDSAVTFLWIAIPSRMTKRYGERGYRYLFLDAGHVGQNLYLASEAIGCGACAVAAFDDDAVNEVLGLDGEREFAIYIGTVGRRA